MRRVVSLVAAVMMACMLLVSAPAVASGGMDQRVKAALDSVGLKYEVDADNDFKLLMEVSTGRTQIVYVNSHTDMWENIEVREVWGPAFPSDGKLFKKKIANLLLMDSQTRKMGAWQAYPQSSGFYAVFNVKMGADSDGGSMRSIIQYVAETADQMEQLVTGKDDY